MIRFFQNRGLKFSFTGERRFIGANPEDFSSKAVEIGEAAKKSPEVQELQSYADELITKGEKDASANRAFALRMNAFLVKNKVMVGSERAYIPEEMQTNAYLILVADKAGLLNTAGQKEALKDQEKADTHEKLVDVMKSLQKKIPAMELDGPLNKFLQNPKDDAARKDLADLINGVLADPKRGSLFIDPAISTDADRFLYLLYESKWISRTQFDVGIGKPLLPPVKEVHEVREIALTPQEIAEWGLKYGEIWKEVREMMRPLESLHHWKYREKRNCITGVHYDLRKDYNNRVYTKEVIPWDYTEQYLAVYTCIKPRLDALAKIEAQLTMKNGKAAQYIRDDIRMVNWMTLYEDSSSLGSAWSAVKPGEVIAQRLSSVNAQTETRVQVVSTAPMVAPKMVLNDPTIVKDGKPFAQFTEQVVVHPDGTREQITRNSAPVVETVQSQGTSAAPASQEMPKAPVERDTTKKESKVDSAELRQVDTKIADAEALLKRADVAMRTEKDPAKKKQLEDAARTMRKNIDTLRDQKKELEGK